MTFVPRLSRPAFGRRDAVVLFGILLFAVVLPTAVGAVSGSLAIPRNDDWIYRRVAIQLFNTGTIDLLGAAAMTLVGQLVVAQPFLWLSGGQPWGLSVLGVLFASVAVISGYLVMRRMLPLGRAAFAILLLPLFPGFLTYAPSFMTDVPAVAAEFTCLGLGMVAVWGRSLRMPWLIASLAVGFLGFTVREFALAAPASVFILAAVVEPRRLAPWLSGAAFAAACLAFLMWKTSLPGQLTTFQRDNFSPHSIELVRHAASTLAFGLLPAAVVSLVRCWRQVRVLDVAIGVIAGFLIVAPRIGDLLTFGSMPLVLLDNVITQWGTPGAAVLVGWRPILVPEQTWGALNGLALVATVAVLGIGTGMIGAVVRRSGAHGLFEAARQGSPAWLLALFAGGMMLGLAAVGLTGSMFDRYLWPLIPPLAALLLVFPPNVGEAFQEDETDSDYPSHLGRSTTSIGARAGTAVGWLLALTLGVTGIVFLLNAAASDAAKWRAGEALVEAGIPAESIDAGYEWVGYHVMGRADFSYPAPGLIWYESLFPSFRLCGLVASTPQNLAGAELVQIDTVAYRMLLFGGLEEPLYLYRLHGADCP